MKGYSFTLFQVERYDATPVRRCGGKRKHANFAPDIPAMPQTRLHIKQTESTNDVGGQWLRTAKPGDILTAWTSDQTRGRGQRGNTWDHSPGLDLALTVAVKWPAEAPPSDPVALNKSVTTGIRDAIAASLNTAPAVCAVGIKWPNDILIQNTDQRWLKCAGILIENTWRGTDWDGTLIGVGVNVNSKHAGANRRCALGEFIPSPLTVEDVADRLSQQIVRALEANDSPLSYETHLVGFGESKRLSVQGRSGMGTVTGVNDHGALELAWTPEGGTTQPIAVERSDALQWDWLWE